MRLKKVGDWIQYSTGQGRIFYYNDKNGDFKWVTPETNGSQDAISQAGGIPFSPQHSQHQSVHPLQSDKLHTQQQQQQQLQQQQEVTAQAQSTSDVSLSDWRAYKDPATGAIFWYNKVTNVSQWECPDEGMPQPALSQRDELTNEEVSVVQSDEDLGLY